MLFGFLHSLSPLVLLSLGSQLRQAVLDLVISDALSTTHAHSPFPSQTAATENVLPCKVIGFCPFDCCFSNRKRDKSSALCFCASLALTNAPALALSNKTLRKTMKEREFLIPHSLTHFPFYPEPWL